MEITFKAQEYTADDVFVPAEYRYKGDPSNGWEIFRNGEKHLQLGPGYELMQTLCCGICSTDIDRRFYAFDLPQITGHEAIVKRPDGKELFAVEINDTPVARGEQTLDRFCREGIPTHSPGRMVLGIDRLPGGFGPYLLAPVNAIVALDGLNEYTAVLIEPFAAALQAIMASPPRKGDAVVVLGPRRLGTLLIAALVAYRASSGVEFRIGAVARHEAIIRLCRKIGADFGIDIRQVDLSKLSAAYDIVYDTTGSAAGFETALGLAKREVHLKSTNGQQMCGLNRLTQLVVDELSILPFNPDGLKFTWPGEHRNNSELYIAPHNDALTVEDRTINLYRSTIPEAEAILTREPFSDRLPRFDLAVAGSIEEIDGIIRPCQDHENSLVRPRSAILFNGEANGNKLLAFLNSGGRLHSSRCGDLRAAVRILKDNPDTAFNLSHYLISHMFPADELATAFDYAKRKDAIKVVVKHY